MLRNGPVLKTTALVISLLLLSVLPAGLMVGQGVPETATAAARIRGFLIAWGDNAFRQGSVPLDTDFVSISAGGNHSLALHENGALSAWGDNSKGQTAVPPGSVFTAISAGGAHSLALRADGTIAAWGDNSQGQSDAPAGANFVAVSAGGAHSLALRADGTIAAWGDNGKGQTNVPAGSFTAIAAGGAHSLALRADGTIVAWGDNGKGQTNVPAGSFTAIAAGGAHSLALRATGTVIGWGDDSQGRLDAPTGANYLAISAGGAHSLAIAVTAAAPKPKPKTKRPVVWNILAVADAGGTITPAGNVSVPNGGTQSFVIAPDAGCSIKDIVVDGISAGPLLAYDFTDVVTDHTIEAVFVADHTITATAGVGGSLTPSGAVKVKDGADQSFTIMADAGYAIEDVVVDGISVGPLPAYDFIDVVADHTIEAVFVAGHTITATAGTGGTISPSGAVKVKDGADQAFTIAAATGYAISDVVVDGVSKGALANYTFADVVADHTIRAEFASIQFTITATILDGIGTVTPPTQTVLLGGTASVIISASLPGAQATSDEVNAAQEVNGIITVTDNGVPVTIPNPFLFTYTINNVQENHVIVVLFGPLQPI